MPLNLDLEEVMQAKMQKTIKDEERNATLILSLGTFLEYFDLMLYVHMAVLLNDLFFSKADDFSSSILGAFSFCITFIFRPIGALLIGWLGDTYGRRSTVILTSFGMSISCIVMFFLPTYQQVGIVASWAITICRIVQGMSSMGERIGAELYLTELIKPPKVYPVVALLVIVAVLGAIGALGIAKLIISHGLNWRYAFLVGAIVAVIGIYARTTLRETPNFVDAKRNMLNIFKNDFGTDCPRTMMEKSLPKDQKVSKKLALSYLCIQIAYPFGFFFVFVHCANILKYNLGYTSEQVIDQNFILSIVDLISCIFLAYCSYFVFPLKILKIRLFLFLPFMLLIPFLLNHVSNRIELLVIQSFFLFLSPADTPAGPIFYKSFPVLKRFTTSCVMSALSRAITYVVASFGLVFLTAKFGNYGVLFLLVPVICMYSWGLFQFIKLEDDRGEKTKREKEDKEICLTLRKLTFED